MFLHRRLLAPEGQEPTATPTPTPTPPAQPEAPPAPSDDFPGKAHMADRINKLVKEIEDMKSAQKAATDEAERKRLEEQGKWQEIAAQEKTKREQLEATHASEKRRWELREKLVGLPSLAISGAIAECPPDADIAQYAAKVLEDNKALLVGTGAAQRAVAQGGRGAGGGGTSLEERLAYNDPKDPAGSAKVRAEARAEKAKAGGYN